MQRVLALVDDAFMVTCYRMFGFLASLASFTALRQPALCPCQFLCASLRVLGIADHVPVAIGHQIANTHIQANGLLILMQRFGRGLTETLQIPAGGTQHHASELEGANQGGGGQSPGCARRNAWEPRNTSHRDG